MSVINSQDAEGLESMGLLSPPSSSGTRRIHKRRLNRSSDEEYRHLPLTPVSSQISPDESYHEIPDVLISSATLEYLGYTHDRATEIWREWTDWGGELQGLPIEELEDAEDAVPFIDFAVGHIASYGDDTCDDDNHIWFTYMNAHGINIDTQEAIMDRVFDWVRTTESCHYWLEDTMHMRYRVLQEIQATSVERTRATQRARSRPGSSDSHNNASIPGSQNAGRRSISSVQRSLPGISNVTALSHEATVAANAPGFTILYKGIDQTRLNGVHDDEGNVVQLDELASLGNFDFSNQKCWYFTPQRETAILYACYAKRREGAGSAVIVHLAIPNSAIESLLPNERIGVYWPSSEWKSLIWHCRGVHKFPSELLRFRTATLIIGTASRRPAFIYKRMRSPEEVTEKHVQKMKDGCPAVQYVFQWDQGESFLMEHWRALQVFPITASEFRLWRSSSLRDLNVEENVEATPS
ncbi:hypothetical protein F5Y05DRAFT_424226 [Hypoxylon sp. FL0543]|nr:hypothetical protein F5Y05DRAFT_424226 [Hypoxylon sp. FL0543]